MFLRHKPHECNINNYNAAMLKARQANIDIQYACIMYVASYMLKTEKAMGQLLKRISQEAQDDTTVKTNFSRSTR